jgi:hypothetical protein
MACGASFVRRRGASGAPEPGTSTFFGFSMPLPMFDRNQGAIAKATAQIRADDLALEAELAECVPISNARQLSWQSAGRR